MKRLSFLIVILVAGLSFMAQAATNENIAGKVKRIKGSVLAVQDAQVRMLKTGDDILIGDILSTGPDAGLEITMIDDGNFILGAKTSFVVVDYTFGQGQNNAVLELLNGAMDGVSGQIAKINPDGMKIDTPVATIGIRGTKFWVGELDGEMNVAHWAGGGVLVKNFAGEVFLEDQNVGTRITGDQTAPTPSILWNGDKKKRAKSLVSF